MEEWAVVGLCLVAMMTGEGVPSPAAQAEPVETMMFWVASRASWMASPSAAVKETFKICGREKLCGVILVLS